MMKYKDTYSKPWLPLAYYRTPRLSAKPFKSEDLNTKFETAQDAWGKFCAAYGSENTPSTKDYEQDLVILLNVIEKLFSACEEEMTTTAPWDWRSITWWIFRGATSTPVFLSITATAILILLANIFDTPPCGIPNPVTATPAAIMVFLGNILQFYILWMHREAFRDATLQAIRKATPPLAWALAFALLLEGASIFLKDYGDVYFTKMPNEKKFCFENSEIGGADTVKDMWTMIGPAIVHLFSIVPRIIALRYDRRKVLGPHGIFHELINKGENRLTFKDKEKIIDSIILYPRFPISKEVRHR